MLRIKLVVLGKLKEKFFSAACDEYIKRLSRYCKLEVCEIPDLSVPDNPSEREIEAVLSKEADAIAAKLGNCGNIAAMCIEGKQYSSEKFADILTDAETSDGSIAFVIGSSHGLADRIKNMSRYKLSMSEMTFPHQLARVMLLEQIYRGFKIKNNENYHK